MNPARMATPGLTDAGALRHMRGRWNVEERAASQVLEVAMVRLKKECTKDRNNEPSIS